MGFNLKAFFEELELIVNNSDCNNEAKLEAIAAEVKWQKEYAEQCGQIC